MSNYPNVADDLLLAFRLTSELVTTSSNTYAETASSLAEVVARLTDTAASSSSSSLSLSATTRVSEGLVLGGNSVEIRPEILGGNHVNGAPGVRENGVLNNPNNLSTGIVRDSMDNTLWANGYNLNLLFGDSSPVNLTNNLSATNLTVRPATNLTVRPVTYLTMQQITDGFTMNNRPGINMDVLAERMHQLLVNNQEITTDRVDLVVNDQPIVDIMGNGAAAYELGLSWEGRTLFTINMADLTRSTINNQYSHNIAMIVHLGSYIFSFTVFLKAYFLGMSIFMDRWMSRRGELRRYIRRPNREAIIHTPRILRRAIPQLPPVYRTGISRYRMRGLNIYTTLFVAGSLYLKYKKDNLIKEELNKGFNECKEEIKAWPKKPLFLPAIFIPTEVLDNLYIYIMSHDSSDFYFITAFLLLFGHSFAFIRLILLIKIYYFGYFNIKTDKKASVWHQIINNYLKRINRLYYKPKTIKNHAKLVLKGIMKICGLVFLGLIAIYFNI